MRPVAMAVGGYCVLLTTTAVHVAHPEASTAPLVPISESVPFDLWSIQNWQILAQFGDGSGFWKLRAMSGGINAAISGAMVVTLGQSFAVS